MNSNPSSCGGAKPRVSDRMLAVFCKAVDHDIEVGEPRDLDRCGSDNLALDLRDARAEIAAWKECKAQLIAQCERESARADAAEEAHRKMARQCSNARNDFRILLALMFFTLFFIWTAVFTEKYAHAQSILIDSGTIPLNCSDWENIGPHSWRQIRPVTIGRFALVGGNVFTGGDEARALDSKCLPEKQGRQP